MRAPYLQGQKYRACVDFCPFSARTSLACQPRAVPWAMELLGFQPASAHANNVQPAAHAGIVQPASVHVLMKIRKKQQKHPTRFSALTGLQCNHATCLGKQAYHAAGIIALRRLHRQRTTSGKNTAFGSKTLHCRSALNIKRKTQNTTHSCRVFSEKTGSCGGRNLERKRVVYEPRKAEKTAVMTWSDGWDAAIGIL